MSSAAKNTASSLLPVILCGGSGTRMWPLSRESYPKQFLALDGPHSMLQQTLLRLNGLPADIALDPSPIVVCNSAHRFVTADQLQQIGIPQARILLEPQGRNTAPALTLAALQATADGSDPLLLAMPADHAIRDQAAFHQAIHAATQAAKAGAMLTFGIVPLRAETGYGYIRYAPQTEAAGNTGTVHAIQSFAEKPDAATAAAYLAAGDYLWNSGLFLIRASVWLRALGEFRPDILQACSQAQAQAVRDLDFIRPAPVPFLACPADSIDYAVMERLPTASALGIPAQVVPLAAGWSDLGAWDAVWENLPQDANGNVEQGESILIDSSNCLIHAGSRLVAGIGLDRLIVVETPDAVLVADQSRTQDVKRIVAELKARGLALAETHRKIHRPWGWYDSIDSGERFQVKRIVVKPGATLSLQMHHHRAEHWIVVRGTAEVTNGEQVFLLSENQSTFIPLGHVHRLANPGKVPLEMIEVQSGSYLGEDDIVRFEDHYGRTETQKPAD